MKRTLIIALALITLSTVFTACSDSFTCNFNGKIEFHTTENTPAIPVSKLQNATVTLYNETGEIVASSSDIMEDGNYSLVTDLTEGNYKIKVTAAYQQNGRNYNLLASSGMFFIAKGTADYKFDMICSRI